MFSYWLVYLWQICTASLVSKQVVATLVLVVLLHVSLNPLLDIKLCRLGHQRVYGKEKG